MADNARKLVEDVLGPSMTREIWSGSYDKVLPVSVQGFELSAVLPAVFYMFRFGERRGKGKFLEIFGDKDGSPSQISRSATIERIAERLSGTVELCGFKGEAEKAILGDLLLCFCLETLSTIWDETSRYSALRQPITWRVGLICHDQSITSPLRSRNDRGYAGQSEGRIRRTERR